MILDFHTHALRKDPNAPQGYRDFMNSVMDGDLDEFMEYYSVTRNYLDLLDREGVDRAVVLAEMAPITSPLLTNEVVRAFAAPSGGRLIPFCSLNPFLVNDLAGELEKAVKEQGFRGVKLYPTYAYFYPNDAMLYPMYAKAQQLGIPVMAHTGSSVFTGSRLKYGDPLYWDDVAVDFPDLTIVMCHGGRTFWFGQAATLVRIHRNVYFDVSGLPPQKLLEYWPNLEKLSDKVLFGSDWPAAKMGANVKIVQGLPISEEAKERILWKNGAAILGLE